MLRILLILLFAFCFAKVGTAQNDGPLDPPGKPRINTYTSTARSAGQIQAVFPYDIPLRSAAGDTLDTSTVFEKNGKPTVLMFWLTTCAPCRAEMAAISSKFESWKAEADFNLYAVSIDFPHNFEQFVKRVEESKWPFPAYHDLDREFPVIMPGNLNGLPQTFLLDKDGNIVHHTRKYSPGDEDKLFELVKSLL